MEGYENGNDFYSIKDLYFIFREKRDKSKNEKMKK
jgi:hypothetical protein